VKSSKPSAGPEDLAEKLLGTLRNEQGITVQNFLVKAEQDLGIRKEVAARSIYSLSQQGTISLEEPRLPLTFAKYLLNHRSMWFWALASIALITAFSIYLLPQSVPFIYTRFVFGALYVLYLPGFALIQLLYPKNDELSPIHRHVLSIGLSLVLMPLAGLV